MGSDTESATRLTTKPPMVVPTIGMRSIRAMKTPSAAG